MNELSLLVRNCPAVVIPNKNPEHAAVRSNAMAFLQPREAATDVVSPNISSGEDVATSSSFHHQERKKNISNNNKKDHQTNKKKKYILEKSDPPHHRDSNIDVDGTSYSRRGLITGLHNDISQSTLEFRS